MLPFSRIKWGVQGGLQGHCHVPLLEFSLLACLLAFPSLPPTLLGKYQFHTLVLPFQCSVDRCLEVGCGSVTIVTSLLPLWHLPSNISIGLEFNEGPFVKREQDITSCE